MSLVRDDHLKRQPFHSPETKTKRRTNKRKLDIPEKVREF